MTKRERRVVVIAPPKLRSAPTVLLSSVPGMKNLAGDGSVEATLLAAGAALPDVVLMYVSSSLTKLERVSVYGGSYLHDIEEEITNE